MRWRILSRIKSKKKSERQAEIIRALFKNRGLITKKQREAFLRPKDPYQLTAKEVGISPRQIKKAQTRIQKAIQTKEKVIVYGDYDTDGVCATAIMWETLAQLGAEVMPFIPKREEGYGLKVERLEAMAKEGVKLVITVDQGIVQTRQVARAKKLGVDVIVTDHHLLGKKKPPALAIIHTTRLAGAGVAWFLAKEIGEKPNLDLVTIGTITDMMPLVGPNRSLVKFGLQAIQRTKRPGLVALFQLAGLNQKEIGAYEVGFIIGPRLNAAGRMDDPLESLRLVCTRNQQRASDLAQKIDQRNRERQDLTKQTALHAREQWLKEDGKSALIFVQHQSYQEGIVGLVASRLTEEFYRPAVVVSQGEEWSKASARSIEGFDIVAAIRSCADLLGPHGGHPRAAGLSVETAKLELLKQRLIALAEKELDQKKLKPTLRIDAEIDLEDLSFALLKEIELFAPFGMGNPQPVFATKKVMIADARTVGRDHQHLKLKIKRSAGPDLEAIGFGWGHLFGQLSPEKPVDLAYHFLLDTWNGSNKLQLRLKDIRLDQ
ncbi:MAG: single-stranded-DNA-specific exonuclease RecJ [Alphaproteobacteria bacterium]